MKEGRRNPWRNQAVGKGGGGLVIAPQGGSEESERVAPAC